MGEGNGLLPAAPKLHGWPKATARGGVVVCWLVFSVPGLTEDAVARQGIRSALCSSEQAGGLWGESRGA